MAESTKKGEKTDPPSKMSEIVRLILTGFGMGTADLVPGVSGGTIAFIFGIYEELIHAIKTVTGKTIQLFLKGSFGKAISSIPFSFLIPLFTGLFLAIILLSKFLHWALDEYPTYVWSFFFGLVLISVFFVGKRVRSWDAEDILAFLAAGIGAYMLVGAVPVETPNNPVWMFGSGAIAICAMILPGISGSFILLILGKYEQILEAVVNKDVFTLLIFMAGCAVGIALFSRLLSWLFARYHDITIAILTGFMLGSLRKIWPWKETVLTRINSKGKIVPIVEENILPVINNEFFISIGLIAAGIIIMIFLERVQSTKVHLEDVHDKKLISTHEKAVKREEHDPVV